MAENETMRAIEIEQPGPPRVLVPGVRPRPYAYEGEVLIRVAAAGVNRPDVLQRIGAYPPPEGAPDFPGLEVAGTIERVGRGVDRWKEGDAVVALLPGGGYAEYAVAHAGSVLPVPDGLTMEEAAGLPETTLTVWHNVFQRGRLAQGEWLLVHGGTSGIGTTAIQLALARGAKVIATAGTPDKTGVLERMGVARAIDYNAEDFVSAVKETTGGHGVDLVLDMVGGDYVERNWRAAAEDGRIVQIAFLNGAEVTANFALLMRKRLTHTGSTLRPRSTDFKAALSREVEAEVWPLIPERYRPVMDATFPLEKAADAHERMEARDHVGKVVLVTDYGRSLG